MDRLRLRFNLNKVGSATVLAESAAVNPDMLLPLEYLQAGEWADVAEVHGEPGWVGRLAELGVRAGSRLQVLRRGHPCLLQVGGSRLSLRGPDVLQILVRPLACPA
jgi:ferrous iron transport protein A